MKNLEFAFGPEKPGKATQSKPGLVRKTTALASGDCRADVFEKGRINQTIKRAKRSSQVIGES